MELIYFDYHATTPQDPRVTEAMLPFFHQFFANSSSGHLAAQPVVEALDKARQTHASYLGAQPKEILFTSSATEANNLVFYSCFETYGRQKNHILLSPIEHKSVIKAAESLIRKGAEIEYVKVDAEGLVDLADLRQKIRPTSLLVSIMHANNEIGSIQDIKAIAEICNDNDVFFHTDAVQTFSKYSFDVQQISPDFITWSSHKFYGPKGVGGLYYNSKKIKMQAQLVGGAHEDGIRAGTVNIAGIVGMEKALEITLKENEGLRIQAKRDAFGYALCDLLDSKKITYKINGAKNKLVNNLNITLLNADRKQLEPKLRRLCYSTGSACASGQGSASHVLLAIGLSEMEAKNTFRFSFGRQTTMSEIEQALLIFKNAL